MFRSLSQGIGSSDRVIHKNPAVISRGPELLDVFTIGLRTASLLHCSCKSSDFRDAKAWTSTEVAGSFRSQRPAVVSGLAADVPTPIDIFCLGAGELDGMLLRYRFEDDCRSLGPLPGQQRGFLANCGPAAVVRSRQRASGVEVFAIGGATSWSAGRCLHRWSISENDDVEGPELLGGRLFEADPCAVVRRNGRRTDVMAVGDDGRLRHWWCAGYWNGPVSRGGDVANGAGPCAVSWGDHRLDIFAVGADRTLQHWRTDGDERWYGPESLGGQLELTTPTAVCRAKSSIDVFATAAADEMLGARRVSWWRFDGTWVGPVEILEWVSAGGPTAVVHSSDGRADIYVGTKAMPALPPMCLFAVRDFNPYLPEGIQPAPDELILAWDDYK
jgi:hypothetical protein